MVVTLRNIPLHYDHEDSEKSAMRLVLTLFPEWEKTKDTIEFVRFKDGITNTLFKAINKRAGLSKHEIDLEAVLIRAYGSGTQVLIDRDRECASHSLLSSQKLAPQLLARFENGLMYRFIPGAVCSPADLRRKDVWRAVARLLAEWHARLPISAVAYEHGLPSDHPSRKNSLAVEQIENLTPGKPSPNIWGVMQKWIIALPTNTEKQVEQKKKLQSELEWLVKELGDRPGVAGRPLVFGHCDLLSANVIIQPSAPTPTWTNGNGVNHQPPSPADSIASAVDNESVRSSVDGRHELNVSFIDYEYATPCPAAFDIANHFAEWGGFECDFSVLPTRSQRRDFLAAYLDSFNLFASRGSEQRDAEIDQLCREVDLFRGAPGLYWGIWALIQAEISQIDFNYAEYAEIRLGEYWAWKDTLAKKEGHLPLRERRWAQESD